MSNSQLELPGIPAASTVPCGVPRSHRYSEWVLVSTTAGGANVWMKSCSDCGVVQYVESKDPPADKVITPTPPGGE